MPQRETEVGRQPSIKAAIPHRRSIVWLTIHAIVYPFFRIWCRTQVCHAERLQAEQGGILLMNHQSYLDPLLVGVRLTRPLAYLARDSLFKVPGIRFILKTCFVIPISRTAFRGSSVRQALKYLESGFLIGLFPEGTRSSGSPEGFRPGFLAIVKRSNVPIYPVAVVGADAMMPKGALFPRPGRVTVVYGTPIEGQQREDLLAMPDREAAECIRQKVAVLYEEGLAAMVRSH